MPMVATDSYSLARASLVRDEIINAIADMAIATRAGVLLKAYGREWYWVDKQNFVDAVDADEFNEAFHGIEREFDKLAQVLAQGAGGLPIPWVSGEISLTQAVPAVLLEHPLNSTDLLVDLKMKLPASVKENIKNSLNMPELDPTLEWWADFSGMGAVMGYILPDPDHILLFAQVAQLMAMVAALAAEVETPELVVQAWIWKW